MTIFASFVHCLPNILHTWPHDSFQQVIWLSMTLGIFQGHWTVSHQISKKNGVWYGKSYYRQLIGNHTLAFDWCHFWWPWSTFEGHFSLGCHFHVHFSNPWHAFALHGLPAIAELLVSSRLWNSCRWCPRCVSLLGGCYRHVARQQQNCCHRMYCVAWSSLRVDERSRRRGNSVIGRMRTKFHVDAVDGSERCPAERCLQ